MTSLGSTPEGGRGLGPDVDQHMQANGTLPLVSIITPCFNGEKHVGRLIESVLAQTYPNVEFILVNDGSTDGTDGVVRSYEAQLRERLSRFVYATQENAGLGGAINTGLRHVTGQYLCWPDADDYLEPTSVEERVAVLEERRDVAVVTSDAYIRDADDPDSVRGLISTFYERNADPWQFELLLRADSIFTSGCHMARMSMFDDSHPVRAIFPARRGQNWQMLLPLYYKFPRHFLDRPLYNYVVNAGSMSRGDATLETQVSRADEHREIKLRTLESMSLSDAERHKWARLVEELRERKVLDVAARAGEVDLARRAYRRVVELGSPALKDLLRMRVKILRARVTSSASHNSEPASRAMPDDGPALGGVKLPMKVSALVTTYNGARFVEAQLESIAQQTLPVEQVVIADDGSTDGTVDVVEQFIRAKGLTGWSLVQNEKNLGPAANFLSHLKDSDGDLILLADQDDVWEPNKSEVIAGYLRRHPNLNLVVSRTRVIDADGHLSESPASRRISARVSAGNSRREHRPISLTFKDFLGSSTIPLHAMGVRGTTARAISELPEFPELSKSLGADWLIGVMSTVNGDGALVPEVLVRRRVHDANISLGRLHKTTALASSNSRRLRMLHEAHAAHLYLLQNPEIRTSLGEPRLEMLADMVAHLGSRISFTQEPSLAKALRLLTHMSQYVRAGDALLPGIRTWVADVMYAYDINWRLRRTAACAR